MKKNVIALLLAVLIASGSVGAVPALAAETAVTETTAEEALAVEEEILDEQEEISELSEDSEFGLIDEDVLEEESTQTEEEPVQVDEETEDEAILDDEQEETVDTAETTEIAEIEGADVIEEEIVTTEENEAKLATTGTCGENATWKLTGTGDNLTLTISGSGDMENYYLYDNTRFAPWDDRRSSIKKVIIKNGITSIGNCAFCGCGNLVSVSLPKSITSIGNSAFSSCRKLTNITIPDSVTSIGAEAFYLCSSLKEIIIPDGVTRIESYTFAYSGLRVSLPNSIEYFAADAFGQSYDEVYETGEPLWSYNLYVLWFRGTKDEWERVQGSEIHRYVIYSTFSVLAYFDLPKQVFNYTGKPVKPNVVVTYQDKQLVEGKDYKLTYKNNTNIGKATVYVNGIGKYSGTATLEFGIRLGNPPKVTCTNVASGMKVSWEKVSGATSYYVYRDDKYLFKTSALVVTDKEVKYKGGTKFTYKVVATNKNTGDSDLCKTCTYYRLMPVGIKSLSNPSAGKMTVTYDKSAGCYGYVIRYGLNKDMSDANVITVKGENTLSRTFAGMKKGKTYYVQVRTYMLDNGVRYYSGYCTTKTITIKK